jgi:hypothetical protein
MFHDNYVGDLEKRSSQFPVERSFMMVCKCSARSCVQRHRVSSTTGLQGVVLPRELLLLHYETQLPTSKFCFADLQLAT